MGLFFNRKILIVFLSLLILYIIFISLWAVFLGIEFPDSKDFKKNYVDYAILNMGACYNFDCSTFYKINLFSLYHLLIIFIFYIIGFLYNLGIERFKSKN